MPARPPRLLVAAGLALALATGCTTAGGADRSPGDPVTETDAQHLAGLLQRNQQRGGADFVVTAPYGEGTVLTLTGSVDFRNGVGRAQAVTSFDDGRPDDVRTLFFTDDETWVGDVPGLVDALAGSGAAGATYLRRPTTTEAEDGVPLLLDVITRVLLNLSAREADDPRAFLGGDYTWEGQRSIDSRLTTLFGAPEGRTVAVDAADDLLTQFVTTVGGSAFDVTVTLSEHGMRRIDLPAEEETAAAAEHPDVAAALGI
ncbi:hypothetical protein [Blastococcus brunescens]|uniref:LppX_LprAFG lipoprotein n=1 Tax=Blastococcus brunescens TaxID=1564165 RepID=A0ABZ1AYY6_9ACTN|nr:hypothetical protein [Blastococcus sp. BMG 8361]WRL63780.1 hypothetical protein U6N30_29775 [Blastococcus sp. BMG 8361]